MNSCYKIKFFNYIHLHQFLQYFDYLLAFVFLTVLFCFCTNFFQILTFFIFLLLTLLLTLLLPLLLSLLLTLLLPLLLPLLLSLLLTLLLPFSFSIYYRIYEIEGYFFCELSSENKDQRKVSKFFSLGLLIFYELKM